MMMSVSKCSICTRRFRTIFISFPSHLAESSHRLDGLFIANGVANIVSIYWFFFLVFVGAIERWRLLFPAAKKNRLK